MNVAYDVFQITVYYPFMKFCIDSNGWFSIFISVNTRDKLFYNYDCFDNLANSYDTNLFNMPKQNNEISKQNEKSLKYIFKRFFGG